MFRFFKSGFQHFKTAFQGFDIAQRRPLKRCKRLGDETVHGNYQIAFIKGGIHLFSYPTDHRYHFFDITVSFPWQAQHIIQLDIFHTCCRCQFYGIKNMFFGNAFIDDITHFHAACFRSHSHRPLTAGSQSLRQLYI